MKKNSLVVFIFVFLVVTSLVVGACAPKAVTKETSKGKIVIGTLEDLSGSTANLGVSRTDGQLDGIRYINEEKGGVNGYIVSGVAFDHKLDPKLVSTGWDKLKSDGCPVISACLTPLIPMLLESANADRIVLLGAMGTVEQCFPIGESFGFYMMPILYGGYAQFCDLVEKDWAKRGKQGKPKLALDTMTIGKEAVAYTKSFDIEMKKRGWEYINTRSPMAPADVTTQVLQMKTFGADYVFLRSTSAAIIAFLKEFDRQNFHPMLYGGTSANIRTIWDSVGDLVTGMIAQVPSPVWTDTDIPLVELCHTLNTKWYPKIKERDSNYVAGFAQALIISHALEMALKDVDYEQLNGDAVMEAMLTIKDYDPGIGISYTWTADDRQGAHGVWWYQWTKDGTMVPVTKYLVINYTDEEKTPEYWFGK